MSVEQRSQALASNYVLVDLEIRSYGFKRTDRDASDELTGTKQAIRGAAKVNTNLLAGADHELKEIQRRQGALRAYVSNRTLPWSASAEGRKHGPGLLATSKALDFIQGAHELKSSIDQAVLELQRVLPQRVAEAKANLGGLDNHQYPDPADIPKLFGVRVDVQPIPANCDFRNHTLPPDLADALADQARDSERLKVESAMDDLRARFTDELERFATQMNKKASGEKGVKLFDTLITNMQALVDLARSMNMTNNPRLAELADKIEAKLLQLPLEAYKDNTAKAAVVASDAKDLQQAIAVDEVWEQI